ncbi:MAG: secretin and TonB N-terminal domain-containing protein [Syntrophales bacterium]|jgi:type IV pilus assembly protein PilQ|nr:secretin and TonB N-terminal domain-containing protein [Syntrophales bacterium]
MKLRYSIIVILVFICTFSGCTKGKIFRPSSLPAPAAEVEKGGSAAEEHCASSVKEITFQRLEGKEKMTVRFAGTVPEVILSRKSEKILVMRLKNTNVSSKAANRYESGALSNIKNVTLNFSKDGAEGSFLDLDIVLENMVPYRIHKVEDSIAAIFDTASLVQYSGPASQPVILETVDTQSEIKEKVNTQEYLEKEAKTLLEEESSRYAGEKMSICCQDAPIESVFRLISEISGYNIVSGADVNQRVTLNVKKVPWDQILETLLEVQGLGMKKKDRVITVLPLEKLNEAKAEELKKNVLEGRIKQISIEAKIVEVSTTFSRELGVKWGYGYLDTWKSRDIGFLIGNSAPSAYTDVATLPSGIGITDSNIAVNFPSSIAAAAPALGIISGTSKYILDAKLEALEVQGQGKIISSPKVTTVDNVKATIGQGEEIPYVSRDDEGNPEVEMKDAKLELTVTPKITSEGKVSMIIQASNKYADWQKTNTNNENPPLVASNVDSTVIVNDGDTIVIGGIYKSTETDAESGVPWLMKIPVLGWLFKEQTIVKDQRELLIFITPRILGTAFTAEAN